MPTKLACLLVGLAATAYAAQASAQDQPTSVAVLLGRGETQFLAGEVEASIESFEQALELEPRLRPQLWQLGISYYYAEQFKAGRELFEAHQRVNPYDVENSAWHFFCVARAEGIEVARKEFLEIETRHDTRIPMREVYDLYAGSGSVEAVLAAAKQADTPRARMYAHLYIGLYHEVSKQPELARKHLQLSANENLGRNYMQGVAKVHLVLLERKSKKAQPTVER